MEKDIPATLQAMLQPHGYELIKLEKIAEGVQSKVLKLIVHLNGVPAASLAAKVFKPDYKRNTPALVEAEYAALCAFSHALDKNGIERVRTPEPVASAPQAMVYIMGYEEGITLYDKMPSSVEEKLDLAERIADGLLLYHRSIKAIHGDFHLGNLMVSSVGNVVFIDMTPPVDWVAENTFGKLKFNLASIDIGYLIYSFAVKSVKNFVRCRFQKIRDHKDMTVGIAMSYIRKISFAPTEELAMEIFSISESHISRLSSASLRGWVISNIGFRIMLSAKKAIFRAV